MASQKTAAKKTNYTNEHGRRKKREKEGWKTEGGKKGGKNIRRKKEGKTNATGGSDDG